MTNIIQEENSKRARVFNFFFPARVVPNTIVFVVPNSPQEIPLFPMEVNRFKKFGVAYILTSQDFNKAYCQEIGNKKSQYILKKQNKKVSICFSPLKKPKNKDFSECYYLLPAPFCINGTHRTLIFSNCILRLPKFTLKFTMFVSVSVDMRRCLLGVVTTQISSKNEVKNDY